jgi:hypothetical protein
MGINGLTCCYNKTNALNTEVKIVDNSTGNFQNVGGSMLKDVKSINDISLAFDYIISGEYYLLLSKITSAYILIEKIVFELNNDDIFVLIENIINWIKKTESIENKIINECKKNIEYGTKKIINEINVFHSQNKIKIPKNYEIRCLSDLSLIAQYIKFINNHDKEKNYEINFWKEYDVEKEIKMLSYRISYNLMKIREVVSNKSSNHNEENTDSLKSNRDKIDSTRDKSSQLFNNIEKFIKDINGKLIK